MDIAALIIAPLLLALVYSRSGITKLPGFVQVGLPVGVLAILFVALLGYAPAVQEAAATKTPLIRDFGGRIFALYMDGLSLLFALLITGIGAMSILSASTVFEEQGVYRRFICMVMMSVGAILGLVLTDHTEFYSFALVFTLIMPLLLISVKTEPEARAARWTTWKRRLLFLAYVSVFGLVRIGLTILADSGWSARELGRPMVEFSLLSTSNLSKAMSYELFFILILLPLMIWSIYSVWQWQAAKNLPVSVHAFVSSIMILSSTYLFARLYPAVHDNPLWWTVVTGVGLLIMLAGSIWALRQTTLKAIFVCGTMSAFGAYLALLGLPEFLGYKVALIGIIVHTLAGAALFLSLNSTKLARVFSVGLARVSILIFHVLMIGAFYSVTLAWSGIALSVVVLNMALWVISAIRMAHDDAIQSEEAGLSLQFHSIISGILAFVSLGCIPLFDPVILPLLNPMVTQLPFAESSNTPLILGIVALIGGGVLYATRDVWGRFVQTALVPELGNMHEV